MDYKTSNISIVATLYSLGFGWNDPEAPCVNGYGKDDHIPVDKDGIPTRAGRMLFSQKDESEEFPGVTIGRLLDQWPDADYTADEQLDDALVVAAADSQEVKDIKRKIAAMLPFALVRYMKACLANRRDAAGMFRRVPPKRIYEEDGNLICIDAFASDETKRELGVAL